MLRKLLAIAGGCAAAGAIALVTAGPALSDGPLDVSGEPYGKAVALLKSQGYKAVFGGSVGSDVNQANCVVSSMKVLSKGRVSLMLNCTAAAQGPAQAPAALPPGVIAVGGAQPEPGSATCRLQRRHHRHRYPGSPACACRTAARGLTQLGGVQATGSRLMP